MSDHPSERDTLPASVSSALAAPADRAETGQTQTLAQQAFRFTRTKAALFAILQAAGISLVTVTFDGSGDEGQIEAVEAYDKDGLSIGLPNVTINYPTVLMEPLYTPDPETPSGRRLMEYTTRETEATAPVGEIIEEIFWKLVGEEHGGWENNDGGFGACHFEVEGNIIRLAMNERYIETNYYEHEL